MFCWFCSLNTVILCATDAWFILSTNKIYTYVLKKSYFVFPITKGSVNSLMKLAGFSTSNKVMNHCSIGGIAPNQVIARSEFEVKFIRSESDEGCDWYLYVTVVTCADTLTSTLCIQ